MPSKNRAVSKSRTRTLKNGGGNGLRNGPGQPSKLTPEVKTRLFDYVRQGVPLDQAAAASGISYQTILNWCERGKSEGKGQYFDFFEEYTRERAVSLIPPQLNWRRQFPTDWRACQAYLRVRDPDNWREPERGMSGMNVQGENVLIIVPEPASAKDWNRQVQQYLSNGGLDGNRRKDRSS